MVRTSALRLALPRVDWRRGEVAHLNKQAAGAGEVQARCRQALCYLGVQVERLHRRISKDGGEDGLRTRRPLIVAAVVQGGIAHSRDDACSRRQRMRGHGDEA